MSLDSMGITRKLQWNPMTKKKELENYPFTFIWKITAFNWLKKNKWTQVFHKDAFYTERKFLELMTVNHFWASMTSWLDKMLRFIPRISEFMTVIHILENFTKIWESLNLTIKIAPLITLIILCRISTCLKKTLAWWII